MGFPLPLNRIGVYALEELEQAIALASSVLPRTPEGGGEVKLRVAEISITFATADGSASPAIVLVSEAPLPVAALREMLERLNTPVYVTLAKVSEAPQGSVGRLVLRVAF